MKTITLHHHEIHKGPLILINYDYPFIDNHDLQLENEQQILLEKRTLNLYHHILDDINGEGIIIPVSGYRTFQQQKDIYEKSLQDNDNEWTSQYVAIPGHSEHQSGYAIDVTLADAPIDLICPHFAQHSLCQKFRQHALQYGFIQRYTKEKESVTHIKEEPWHFRYVGIPHALYMAENNLCLEEYIEEIKQYHIYQPLHYLFQNHLFSIFYIPSSHGNVHFTLKDDTIYQVSGNNVDGFIVTIWRAYV